MTTPISNLRSIPEENIITPTSPSPTVKKLESMVEEPTWSIKSYSLANAPTWKMNSEGIMCPPKVSRLSPKLNVSSEDFANINKQPVSEK